MKKKKWNINSIFSLIFSIISYFKFWWLCGLGLGLGIRAIREIKNNNERGKIMAIIGSVLGGIPMILYVVNMVK